MASYLGSSTEAQKVTADSLNTTTVPASTVSSSSSATGRTSPLMSAELQNALNARRVTGLVQWMIDFQRTMPELPKDNASNAEPKKVVTTHLVWDVEKPDFETRTLTASATYDYNNLIEGNETLILDVMKLNIKKITVNGEVAQYRIVETEKEKPDALHITIPPKTGLGKVSINYSTSPDAPGIFWVEAKYTEGKQHPLVYTLFQPIEGASAIPGQHTPQVRLTYVLNADSGSSERMVLSSVSNNPAARTEDGKYCNLRMSRAVPLYLLSLNVGNFSFRSYPGGETGVYAEQAMIERAASGFNMLPPFMQAAKEICGPYNWQTYCPVILGWAFPYMAMEHPCASTCGSICLEQPDVLAHELAHSWTGNDTTNCNWQQFFWNEGWTTFIEYLILEKVRGKDYATTVLIFRLQEAYAAMEKYKDRPEILKLVSNSNEFEFTRIPYAKGALFFFMLREAVTPAKFDEFTQDYMKVFYQNTMSDSRFLEFLKLWLHHKVKNTDFDKFKADHLIDEWLYGTNIPSNAPQFTSTLLDKINQQSDNVLKNQEVDVALISSWEIPARLAFLSRLEGKASKEQLKALDEKLHLTSSPSMSITGEWALLCSMSNYFTEEIKEKIVEYVIKRNSLHEANKITSALCKSNEGTEIAEKILEREQGRLFTVTKEKIRQNIANRA
jgi:leukotriene-A4 hydrolase